MITFLRKLFDGIFGVMAIRQITNEGREVIGSGVFLCYGETPVVIGFNIGDLLEKDGKSPGEVELRFLEDDTGKAGVQRNPADDRRVILKLFNFNDALGQSITRPLRLGSTTNTIDGQVVKKYLFILLKVSKTGDVRQVTYTLYTSPQDTWE